MIHLQKITAILLLLLSLCNTSGAQETQAMKLDLETSINIAKDQSYTMLMLKEGLNAAQYQLKAANSSFKTHINMDITAPNYSESIDEFEGTEGMTYFSNKQLSYSGSLTIDQPLPTDGRLFVRSSLYNTDDYDQDEKFMKLQTRIGLTQPIQSLYAYNSIRSEYEKALENRLELKEQQLQIDLTNIELKRIKSKGTLSGDLEAYYDFVGMDKYDINKSLGGAINGTWGTLKDRPNNFGVLLKLKIPILDWGENRSRVKAVKAQIKQSVYQQEAQTVEIESQVIRTVNEVHSTLRRLELLKKNKVIAEKSFAISQNRFSNGDIDSQTLALDRERLDKTNESHLRAFINYKLKLADLMRKTFYDFEKDQDVIY